MAGSRPDALLRLLDSFGVLFSGILLVFLQSGTFKALGVLFEEVVLQYETTNFLAGWVFTFQAAASFIVAGVVGVFMESFTNRAVGVTGGVFFGLGLVFNGVFRQTVVGLFFFTGTTAVGGGLLYFSSFMSFLEHFDEDMFPLAYSIRELFTYLGITVIPLMMDMLRREYGLKGAFLILGGVTWNCVVAGVLMKPPRARKCQVSKSHSAVYETERNSEDGFVKETTEVGTTAKIEESDFLLAEKSDDIFEQKSSLETPSLFQDTSEGTTSIPNVTGYVTSHKHFAVFNVIHALFFYIFGVWAIFLVPYGTLRGLPEGYPVFLSTSGGLGGFLGKIVVFVVNYYGKMNTIVSSIIPSIICGFSLTGYLFADNFEEMLLASFVCGFSVAFADAALNSTFPRYVCSSHTRQLTTVSYFTSGIVMQIGGIISGALLDLTGSIRMVFGLMLALDIATVPFAVYLHTLGPTDSHCSQ